jgi:hypothetical protein
MFVCATLFADQLILNAGVSATRRSILNPADKNIGRKLYHKSYLRRIYPIWSGLFSENRKEHEELLKVFEIERALDQMGS